MTVTSLVAYKNRQERVLLQDLLQMSEQVEIHSLAVCMLTAEGEIIECTGGNSRDRVIAALKLSRRLNDIACV